MATGGHRLFGTTPRGRIFRPARARGRWAAVGAAGIVLLAGCATGSLAGDGGARATDPVTVTATTTVPAPVVIGPTSSSGASIPTPTATPTAPPAAPTPSSPTPVPTPPPPTPSSTTPPPPPPPAPAVTPTPGPDRLVASPDPAAVGSPPCPGVRCVSLAISGDVLLHPELVDQARADGAGGSDGGRHGDGALDFFPVMAAQQPFVAGADVAVCHLETPLAPPDGPFRGYPSFSVPPQVLPALVRTGYDACTTASNHTLDRGTEGLDRTLDELDAAGLIHDGSYRTESDAQTPVVINSEHGRLALISATFDLNGYEPDQPWQVTMIDTDAIIEKAARARAAGADLVVVALHAGNEYDTTPSAQQKQVFGALLADPNIDLVYGHHAHVVQPMERIDGKWAIYGLGNAIAAQSASADGVQEGLLVRVQFSQDATGAWTTSDVAWVASHQDRDAPYRWCALSPTDTCGTGDADVLAGTTATVNRWGADTDGGARRLN